MIRHIVMWKFKEESEGKSKEENMNIVRNMLYSLPAIISEIRRLEIGSDVRHTDMSADLVLITEFDTLEALEVYAKHPEHMLVSQYVRKVICDRVVIDVQI
jgi:hypothetical protein